MKVLGPSSAIRSSAGRFFLEFHFQKAKFRSHCGVLPFWISTYFNSSTWPNMETSVAISVTPKIGWLIPMIKTHEIHHELCHTSLRDGSTKIPVKNQADHFSGIYFLQCKGRHGKMISDLLAFFTRSIEDSPWKHMKTHLVNLLFGDISNTIFIEISAS